MVNCLLLPLHGSKAQVLAEIAHDLDAAAASNNRGQLLECWRRWHQLQTAAGSATSSSSTSSIAAPASAAELQAIALSSSQQQQQAWRALLMFLQQTSFADAACRQEFISERVLPVLRQLAAPAAHLAAALEQQGSAATLDSHEAQQLLTQLHTSLSDLTAVQGMLQWQQELCSHALGSSMLEAIYLMEKSHNRALVWQLQSLLLRPIWHCHDDISTTISAIVQQSLRQGQEEQALVLKRLSVLLQLAACRWCSGLMLPESLLLAAAAGASQGPGITAALVDRLAALSCQATLANGLAAALEGADKALSQAAQGASFGGSSADASHRQRTGSRIKKKQKAKRKQQKRQQKQELKALHSNAAIASLQQAAEAVDVLADGEHACQLLRWLSHTQCTAHSSLAEALLADCKAAGAASAAGGSQPLPLHVAQSGQFGRCLQGAGAASLSPALASCWADLLLGLPVAAAASITAVQVLQLDDLRDTLCSLHEAACSSLDGTAAGAPRLQVLLVVDGSSADAAACPAALVWQQQPGRPSAAHVVADSSSMQDVMAPLQAWLEEEPQRMEQVKPHYLSATAADDDESAEAQHELLVLLSSRVKQLVLAGTAGSPGAETLTAPPAASAAAQGFLAAALQQHSNQEQIKLLQHAQQLLLQVQQLQDCLADVLDSTDVRSEATAAKQKMKAMPVSVFGLRSQAQELEQHVRQLHDRHLRVTSLAAGQRMLAQLQQLSKQAPHALELRRLTKAIKDQMGCADTYKQYTQLVSKLRGLCKVASLSAQQQLGSSPLAGQQDMADKLYAAAPAAAAFLIQVCGDVLGCFEATNSSIRLVRQHTVEQLQLYDQQLLAILQQLVVPRSTVEQHGFAGLLVSFEQLLTAPIVAAVAAAEDAGDGAGQQLRARAVLDNATARLQQKQEMLSSLEQQLARLLAEARGVKPSPGALVSGGCCWAAAGARV